MDIQDSLVVDELKRDSSLGIRLLVEKYQNRLSSWGRCQYESINYQDLIEIIEDTFMRVIEKIDAFQFRTEKGFRNWVYTIFSRLCIDHLRKKQRLAEHMQILSLDSDLTETNRGEFQSVRLGLDRKIFQDCFSPKPQEHMLVQKVRDFLECLDENNRIIIQACDMEIPHREIAEWTGIPLGYIRVYYSRLKKKWKSIL